MFKSTNFVKHKLKKAKLPLLIRVTLICMVVGFFYLRSLLLPPPAQYLDKLNENFAFTSNMGRKILSVDFSNEQHQQSENCSEPAILEFPWDGFTREERQHGWIIIHIVLMSYGFVFLATICDDYLVPSIERICTGFNIDRNVIGATVTAAAVSSPQLFVNCIGTFITKSDIGVTTIVGSAIFKVLAIPAICGLFVTNCLKFDWWSITRDYLMYLMSVLVLVIILSGGQVWWYEAVSLILMYLGCMLIIYYNTKITRLIKKCLRKRGYYKPHYKEVTELTGLLVNRSNKDQNLERSLHSSYVMLSLEQHVKDESLPSPWSCENQTFIQFLIRWPITFLLWLTVPNSRKHNCLKYLSFVLSIIWIAGISYIVAFAATVIGDTLNIPDAAMGLTILAAGMSIPEAVSSIIVIRQDQGCMGMSNSLGSNTFDILLSLGLPWFIKAFFLPEKAEQKLMQFDSFAVMYEIIMLLTALLAFYLLLALNKFTLNLRLGLSCLITYMLFMITAVLVELNLFFPINLPKCRYFA